MKMTLTNSFCFDYNGSRIASRSILLVLLCFCIFFCVDARGRTPLIEDPSPKIRNKAAECIFGNEVRELGSAWVPDLGVPIGVLYCMKCECIQIQKKRRIVAKVQCRSIKNECPEPSCAEPVLLPERCCKTCPGDTYLPDVIQDVIRHDMVDGDDKNAKHYAALLTDRSSLQLRNDNNEPIINDNKNNVIATGRFTFHKRNLYYSFYISDKAARPRTLQFVNYEGHILEEHILSDVGGHVSSRYQNATRKVCGVWKRLPKDYRKMLRDERMYVVLGWGSKEQAEFTLSAQLMKYVALGTELFSSLLEPSPGADMNLMAGSGGTAIVSISTQLSPSIHIAVVFNGLFTPEEIHQVPLNITLTFDDRKVILTEKVYVQKPATELNLVEISSPISQSDLRHLTRGKLVLSISSVSNPTILKLSGMIMTKATCELFQTPLSSSGTEGNKLGISGLAWVYLNNEGSLVYNVQVDDVNPDEKPLYITLNDMTGKKRLELEDLTPSFNNGWANGTIDKLSPKVLEPLYSGNLAVNVVVNSEMNIIRGRLTPKLVADARDASAPVLLKREDNTLPASAVGMGWFVLDNDCHLHYDVTLTGLPNSEKSLELSLKFLPMSVPGAPYSIRVLDPIQGNQLEGGTIEPLMKEELSRLDTGVVFVKIRNISTKDILLKSTLREVKVPVSCLSIQTNSLPSEGDSGEQHKSCNYDNRYYQVDERWTSVDNPCEMCFCQDGKVHCDISPCPDNPCPKGMNKTKFPGECCPVCRNATIHEDKPELLRGCVFNGKFFSVGAVFHPFLIPTGFDRCTKCECDESVVIKCARIVDNKICCNNCQPPAESENGTYVSDPSLPVVIEAPIYNKSVTKISNASQILSEGGCINSYDGSKPYKNGQTFHPYIEALGEYKCVTCTCNNGNIKCHRFECTRKMCRSRKYSNQSTQELSCCSSNFCRKRHGRRRKQNMGY
ncbi:dorsal-ventral patterning protein Sog isoform X2 [Onthophagus taurus]|uniref:dorsal-ventral patterning protein Sog isoform X2 n=1 Tax=Onthophagus taurus TaxID=166361 RepID=UPI000C206C45|nr:dorsal-ventral patterning protein Sog isoform X2 [Onthophagus taurus]